MAALYNCRSAWARVALTAGPFRAFRVRKWIPAASFMVDTCAVAIELWQQKAFGIYHLDSNRDLALSFFDLVCKINERYRCGWTVQESDDVVHDQRLLDDRIVMPCLSEHL